MGGWWILGWLLKLGLRNIEILATIPVSVNFYWDWTSCVWRKWVVKDSNVHICMGCYMRVQEFAVFLPCSKRFSLGTPVSHHLKKILKSWFVTERTHVDKFLRTFKCFVAKKNNDTNQNENEPSQCTYYPLFKLFLLPMTILSFLSVPSISVINSTNKSSVLCSLMFYWCPDPFNS